MMLSKDLTMPYTQRELTLKTLRSFALLSIAILLLYPQTTVAEALRSPRVFTRGSFVYVVEPERIVFLSMGTRTSHALYSASDPVFSIVSVARSGDMIWATNGAGAVIGVNMQTGTVEEYGRSRIAPNGHIDADARYLWLAADDTLFRMDMNSREWVSIPIPDSDMDTVRGVMSFNDRIHIAASRAVYIYRPATGDWVTVPHKTFVLGAGDFHRVDNVCYFTQGKTFYRYDPSKRLWNGSALRDTIRAVSLTPEALLAATERRVYQYSSETKFVMEPHPAIPMLRGIRAVTRHNGYVVCAVDRGLAVYTSPFDFNLVYYPDHINPAGDVSAFSYDGNIILYTNNGFIIYHHDRRLWSGVPVIIRDREQAGRYAWDENGAHAYLTDEYKSTLNGALAIKQHPGFTHTETGGLEVEQGAPIPNATLNLHTEDPDGRFFDITADNAETTLPPQKGFYYKGIDGDILSRASFGVQGTGMTAGQVTPNVLSEGVSASFTGRTNADNRDRGFMTAAAGSGFILSKTEWRSFRYEHSGVYRIDAGGSRGIVASSVKMYVDGAALSGADYVYDPASRAVRLLRRDKTDPTSVIQISFSVKALPNDPQVFEPLPENHFGQYNFVEGSISPRSWLSARAGVLSMGGDTAGPVIFASSPVEWRGGGANRSFLFTPEVAYDSRMGTHAAGVTLGARDNRAFGSYRGYWAARDFNGIDKYSFDNRNVGEEHDIDFGYDLRDDLRVGWRQLHRNMDFGSHTQFEMYSNYTGDFLPDIEMALSSRLTDLESGGGERRRKETAYLRLSDMSSSYLTEVSRMHNVGYDLSFTEYRTNFDENGRALYGWASVSPIRRLTFTGSGLYRVNPPGYDAQKEINPRLEINTHDLPVGVDAAAGYSVYITERGENGTSVGVERNLSGYVYPGEYVGALDRFALYLAYNEHMESRSRLGEPSAKLYFWHDGRTFYRRVLEEAGLIFFPAQNLLMSAYNSRIRTTDGPTQYRTVERAKLWFESGSSVEGNIDIRNGPLLLVLHANSLYEHRWNESLMTGAGVFGTRYSENYIVDLSGGPRFIVSLTKELSGFIRSVENSHLLGFTVNNAERAKPDIDYSFHLRLKMPPNISLVAELHVFSNRLRETRGEGGLYLHAGF